jgi:energy-coupling factor transporter transmembrane protein EcfT
MLARGYAGQFLTLNPHQMRSRDWVALFAVVLVLLLIQLLGRVLF